MSSFAMKRSLRKIALVARRDGRYKVDAYLFVQQALAFAQLRRGRGRQRAPRGAGESSPASDDHLTAQELCQAIRVYAHDLFGLLAKAVLNSWGVRSTSDFGEIVFHLIEIGELTKSANDVRADFDDVYEFDDAFQRQYPFQMMDDR